MQYKSLFICLIGVVCLLGNGCTKSEQENIVTTSKSTLIYMVADNNLDYYGVENIKELEQGLPPDGKGYVFVFVDRNKGGIPSHPYLLQIHRDTVNQFITSTILQSYEEQNSCTSECLKQIIKDVEVYSATLNTQLSRLVLWSHGSGWLPRGTSFDSDKHNPMMYSFGMDEGQSITQGESEEMEITELAEALSGHHFEYLIMDACFMGNIETAYELKDYFDYMILSPSEILSMGYPYVEVACDLISDDVKVQNIADKYFTYYANKKNAFCSATISVVNCQYLMELAQCMQKYYKRLSEQKKEGNFPFYDRITQYDRTKSNYFFDFKQFVTQSCNDKAILKDVLDVWSKVLISYKHTEKMFSVLDLSETSGLSIYIPNNYDKREKIHTYYKKLRWSEDSGASLLLD